MKTNPLRIAATVALAGAVSVTGIGAAQAGSAQKHSDDTLKFGWTSWADAKFITNLAEVLIEKRTDHKVKLSLSSIGVQYKGVATGDLDAMLMSWLPDTHANYIEEVGDSIVNLGTLYGGAKLGWVVPAYVPKSKLNSIKDLHKDSVRKKLDGKIQGIDPGAGIMQLSADAMKAYGLKDEYRLLTASGPAMTAALKGAIQDHKWIVVTLWTPHWAFGAWDLRFLKDPKNILGGPQHIAVQAREGFKEDYPKVATMLSNMHVKLSVLQKYMYMSRQKTQEKAISDYIEKHQSRIDGWFSGESSSS